MIRQVKISGRTFKVVSVPELTKPDGTTAWGHFSADDHIIRIVNYIPEIEQADTLLHEINHAIDFYSCLGMTEGQVSAMASQQIGVLKYNPSLLKYITEAIQ